ncbi:MAG: iron sulfur, CDGSH-type [Hyphomicrobiales bacterium]|nr:iron sulfur, CDGSH-type [Hyphomicrobiales bacterium]
MSDPVMAQKGPYSLDVEAGTTYWWCSCGRSASQPFCDGSHKGTDFTPMEWTAPRTRKVHFCGCKQALNKPMCDGTHGKI